MNYYASLLVKYVLSFYSLQEQGAVCHHMKRTRLDFSLTVDSLEEGGANVEVLAAEILVQVRVVQHRPHHLLRPRGAALGVRHDHNV